MEDNILNQVLTRTLIERLGLNWELAVNGKEAVDAFAIGKFLMISMDYQAPVMDGYAATGEIRKREAGLIRTPIIALTANALIGDRKRCLYAGMDDLLSKPVRATSFRQMIGRWLDLRSSADHERPDKKLA